MPQIVRHVTSKLVVARRARALAVWEDTLKSHLPTESENFTVLPLRVLSFSK